jgi:hypothetical protein
VEDHRATSIVLVELDAILDTRLPVMGLIASQAALDASKDDRYFNRLIDDFSEINGIGKDAFRQVYLKRDADVARASVITEIPFILNELVTHLEQEARDTPFLKQVQVEVNVYPYEFDAEERDMIALAVMSRCGIETEVKCIRIPPAHLTPQFCKGRYSGLILYNFRDWMEHHLEGFKHVKMPRVSVMAPALYYDVVPADDAFVGDGLSEHITAFQLSEVGCIELFALSLLPASNFSMARIPGHYQPKPQPQAPKVEVKPSYELL